MCLCIRQYVSALTTETYDLQSHFTQLTKRLKDIIFLFRPLFFTQSGPASQGSLQFFAKNNGLNRKHVLESFTVPGQSSISVAL